MSLSGQALAVLDGTTCEDDPYYGTMTQEIFGAKWQDDVIALAAEDSDIDMAQNDTETAVIRAVFGKGMASQRKDNENFTFAVAESPVATATGGKVSNKGVITAGTQTGVAVIEVTLTNYPKVAPAYIKVTVA